MSSSLYLENTGFNVLSDNGEHKARRFFAVALNAVVSILSAVRLIAVILEIT